MSRPLANNVSKKADEVLAKSDADDDALFELDEYNSEDEGPKTKAASHSSTDPGLSTASIQLMQK